MGGRPYCLLLTLAAVAVNNLDCGTPGPSHLRHRDVMDDACQHQLSDDIETCLSGYERLLVTSRALDTKPGQLRRSVVRRLCREYYETLQCLYNSLLKCSADEPHLYVIANRVGHLRTFMQQTCGAVNSHPTAADDDRHPPEVTSRREASHVTTTPSEASTTTRRPEVERGRGDGDGGGRSSKCSEGTTPGAPMSQSLHSSAVTTTSSLSLITAAVFCSILRRHCPA